MQKINNKIIITGTSTECGILLREMFMQSRIAGCFPLHIEWAAKKLRSDAKARTDKLLAEMEPEDLMIGRPLVLENYSNIEYSPTMRILKKKRYSPDPNKKFEEPFEVNYKKAVQSFAKARKKRKKR